MIRLLQFLLHGCWHVWKTKEGAQLVKNNEALPHGLVKYCQCTKCGEWKAFRL